MTTREVVLDGGSPWGFRLHGGADLKQPLRISRVNPGSKAALRGIREGDFITSINDRSTKNLTNSEAHSFLKNSGNTIKLGLNEECGGSSPKRRQYKTVHQETTSETVKKSSVTSYTLTSSKTVSVDHRRPSNGNTNGDCSQISRPPVVQQRSTLSSTCSSSSSTPSGMADCGRSRRRRGRNNRRRKNHVQEEYRVESPQRKKPVKSRSLDDDDDRVKIQEMSEVSENEEKNECKAIVSEAESDKETIEHEEIATVSILCLQPDQDAPDEPPLISPEEELTLRNFLEGLHLVNSPEESEQSTIESVKSRRAKKRAALEQYFNPIVQNPRFLDVISEETSDLSDREQQSLTQHLKQGTPEPELPTRRRTSQAVLLGTRIISAPVTHQLCSSSEAEVVFLEDSSNSSTPDPKSDHEEEKDTNTDSSVPDLRDAEVEDKKIQFEKKKSQVLEASDSTTPPKNVEHDIAELTPPPTPESETETTSTDQFVDFKTAPEEINFDCGINKNNIPQTEFSKIYLQQFDESGNSKHENASSECEIPDDSSSTLLVQSECFKTVKHTAGNKKTSDVQMEIKDIPIEIQKCQNKDVSSSQSAETISSLTLHQESECLNTVKDTTGNKKTFKVQVEKKDIPVEIQKCQNKNVKDARGNINASEGQMKIKDIPIEIQKCQNIDVSSSKSAETISSSTLHQESEYLNPVKDTTGNKNTAEVQMEAGDIPIEIEIENCQNNGVTSSKFAQTISSSTLHQESECLNTVKDTAGNKNTSEVQVEIKDIPVEIQKCQNKSVKDTTDNKNTSEVQMEIKSIPIEIQKCQNLDVSSFKSAEKISSSTLYQESECLNTVKDTAGNKNTSDVQMEARDIPIEIEIENFKNKGVTSSKSALTISSSTLHQESECLNTVKDTIDNKNALEVQMEARDIPTEIEIENCPNKVVTSSKSAQPISSSTLLKSQCLKTIKDSTGNKNTSEVLMEIENCQNKGFNSSEFTQTISENLSSFENKSVLKPHEAMKSEESNVKETNKKNVTTERKSKDTTPETVAPVFAKKIFSKLVDSGVSSSESRTSQNVIKKCLVRTVPVVIEEYRKRECETQVHTDKDKDKDSTKEREATVASAVTNIPKSNTRNIPIKIEGDKEVKSAPITGYTHDKYKPDPRNIRNIPIITEPSETKYNTIEEVLKTVGVKIEDQEQITNKINVARNIPIKIEFKNEDNKDDMKSRNEETVKNISTKIGHSEKGICNTLHERIVNVPIILEEQKETKASTTVQKLNEKVITIETVSRSAALHEKNPELNKPIVRNIPIDLENTDDGRIIKHEKFTDKKTKGMVVTNIPIRIERAAEENNIHISKDEIKEESSNKRPTIVRTVPIEVENNKNITNNENKQAVVTNIPIRIERTAENEDMHIFKDEIKEETINKRPTIVRTIPIEMENDKKIANNSKKEAVVTNIIHICKDEIKEETSNKRDVHIARTVPIELENYKQIVNNEKKEAVVTNIIHISKDEIKGETSNKRPTIIRTVPIEVEKQDEKSNGNEDQKTTTRDIPIKIETKNEDKSTTLIFTNPLPSDGKNVKEKESVSEETTREEFYLTNRKPQNGNPDIENRYRKFDTKGPVIKIVPVTVERDKEETQFVLNPPNPSPSSSLSSGSSSRATSFCTAKFNSMSGSIGDITSIKDEDTQFPSTLRELCLQELMSLPFGVDMLQELADVSSSIQNLTNAAKDDPRLFICLSPTQRRHLDKSRRVPDEASKLLDLHSKFIFRRSQAKNDFEGVSNRLLAIIRDAEETSQRVSADMESARLKEFVRYGERRRSLPNELYAQQMVYLQEKEREIQRELEMLEDEKRKLVAEMGAQRVFRAEDYHISKRGDFAENRKTRPASMPSEFFRQQMYEEYLEKIAAMEERKHHQVVKVTQVEGSSDAKSVSGIKDEFMDKVKQKQKLGKLLQEEESQSEESDKLPKHLQEFMDITQQTRNSDGVWSPGQKHDSSTFQDKSDQKDEPISPVWVPKSATSSPTADRKEFRPIKYESPVLSRRQPIRAQEESGEPPWKIPETSSDTGIVLSSALEKRLPNSHSAPASGFSDFSTNRLPRAQNPTITLLQKAREGQLPKGALYIEDQNYGRPLPNDRPPLIGPGEILYKIKNEYTSESDGERPRKMADLGPRKFEGIGPTTKDGMPLILRSEVKDTNQSKWYKKMYDTIHKQKPHRDEYVTVRYKQRRGQYPYTSGYLSEPEPGAYDSDFTGSKYATLDRRRLQQREYVESSTMPRNGTGVIKHGHDTYKNQPGRIENYVPGHSSISEKEAREWWDEVMDIFDGHLEQQKRAPQTKSFMNQALKESGYESDSTLVFRRRDDTAQQLSPLEQKEAYKIVQKGGDVPLHGFRKPAPVRPKEEPQLEYFPISPTLTRIRVHKTQVQPQREIVCYPVTIHPHPSTVFARYKRTAPSAITAPPSPPKRRSSRNNSTLRLISTMKVKTEKKRHETCFTSTVDTTNVKYLRDRITCKLAPSKGKDIKPKLKVTKTVSASPELKNRIVSTLSTTKDPTKTTSGRIQSRTNVGKLSRTKTFSPPTKTFGSEKRKVSLTIPKVRPIVGSPDLVSPTEVKKAVEAQRLPPGTVYKKSKALLSSARNGTATNLKHPSIPIRVGVSDKGKTILRTNLAHNLSTKTSLESLKSVGTKRIISTVGQAAPKPAKQRTKPAEIRRIKKATKEEINGEIAATIKSGTKCAGRAAGTEIVRKLRQMDQSTDLQRHKEAIQSDYFFQHLFLRDLPSPTPSSSSRTSWLMERYRLSRRPSSTSEPTISAMKVYLKHTRPVTDSKFKSLDLSRSRSTSPKSVSWHLQHVEKRSTSLPPKLVFPQSPSSRRIMQLKPKRELSIYACPSVCQSTSSLDVQELSRKSSKFKDLNDFYSTIEKFGELEQQTNDFSLKPRRRFEDEIIDYDRWREVRRRERAEEELKTLVERLKENAKDKGFLFSTKEVDRWKRELDRGLRVKEKSVDNIKEEFERLAQERESAKRRQLDSLKDTYKPLWRGDSVLELANKMVERRSQSEERVHAHRQKLIDSERMLTHGIGSRLWSSLSSEQVNILKNQLSEIYSQNLHKRADEDFSVHVPEEKSYRTSLSVRRNSDSTQDNVLTEHQKKNLSQSISKEVMDHVRARAFPEPIKALVQTDAVSLKHPSTSETESGSTDESNKTVIQCNKDEIKKKVEYFENVAEQEKYTPTVYKPCDFGEVSSTTFSRGSMRSRSYQSVKEFFGEQELMRFATLPLSATRRPAYVSPERPQLRATSPSVSEATSTDSFFRSRSISPYAEDALALVKSGEVRRLRGQFEGATIKRSKSDSSLFSGGEVELLRSKYEYPAHAGRGRSRLRRGGVVSPTFLRAEDRFMPHINIISKIANLYARKRAECKSGVDFKPNTGDVDKMKRRFDVGEISLLGHMFTSSPDIKELRDVTPYLTASWIAHKYPRSEDNTRSLSSPDSSIASRDTTLVRRNRPKSASPLRQSSSILKQQEAEKPDQRYKSWWNTRPSVSFKEPEPPLPPPKGRHGPRDKQESPRKYVENEVTIHYKTPVRQEIKEYLSEDELAYRQAEAMKKIYQEERRRKYLQVSKSLQELQDMNSRRHTDNFIPSQKSPISLNRYDDFEDISPPVKPRPRSPEPRLLARALYNFVGQTARELTFRKGDVIHVRRQVDKNWYEGELNAMVGLFPVNYVEIVTYDAAKSAPRKSHEGQARAKYNFVAQTHLELSLAKGELVVVTRRVDDNWFEGKIGGRKGIFPVSYVEVLVDPGDPPVPSTKPVASPAAHSLLLNGSAGGKQSMGSHSYTPALTANQLTTSYHAKPVQVTGSSYGSLNRTSKNPVGQALHIETQSEPVPYRALYKYLPQNDDELELLEGDTVFVLEKCDDGWYVGSSERTGAFGTFPGNYVEKI